jgi:ribosome-binding factor A
MIASAASALAAAAAVPVTLWLPVSALSTSRALARCWTCSGTTRIPLSISLLAITTNCTLRVASSRSSSGSSSSDGSAHAAGGAAATGAGAAALPRSAPSPEPHDSLPRLGDEYYWLPHSEGGPRARRSVSQRRVASRLENTIEALLHADGALRRTLVDQYGLTVHRVELSRDRRTVYVLWDAAPGCAADAAASLQHNAFRLRARMAEALRLKHTPFLEFRHNHLPHIKAAVAATMEALDEEYAAEASSQADGDPVHDPNSGQSIDAEGMPTVEDVTAAIARLEAATAPRSV